VILDKGKKSICEFDDKNQFYLHLNLENKNFGQLKFNLSALISNLIKEITQNIVKRIVFAV
jgi:hypothetical protein